MSRLRQLEATAHNDWYRPAAHPARDNIRHLIRLTRRYQALVQATLEREREASRARTRAD